MGHFTSDNVEGVLQEFFRRLEGSKIEKVKVTPERIYGIYKTEMGTKVWFVLDRNLRYGFTGAYRDDDELRKMAGERYVPYFAFPFDVGNWLGEDPMDIYQTEQVRRRLVQAP